MSDAIAKWYLGNPEMRPRLRELLLGVDRGALAVFLERERESPRLRNDDIAMVLIEIRSED